MKLTGRLSFATIQKLCVLYLILWSIVPPMMLDNIYRYLGLAACVILLLLAFLRGFKLRKIHVYAILFAVLVAFCSYVASGGFGNVLRYIAYYLLVICFIAKEFYNDKIDELSWIVPVIILVYIYFNYKTASALIDDSTLSRLIVRNDENTYSYIRSGVGGYAYIYTQVCIFPALVAWIIKSYSKNKLFFGIGFIWFITYIVVLANANYSIAIFSTVISLIVLLSYKGKSVTGVIFLSLFLFMLLLMSILYIDPWRKFLLELFDGTAVAKKINDLVASADSGEAEGSIASRTDSYIDTLKTIFSYPIIGSLWKSNDGGHSIILCTLGNYGVFGLFVFIKSFFCNTTYYNKKYDYGFMRRMTNATIVSLMLVAILDATPYQFMPVVILYLSMVMRDVEKWTVDEYENPLDGEFNSEKLSEAS